MACHLQHRSLCVAKFMSDVHTRDMRLMGGIPWSIPIPFILPDVLCGSVSWYSCLGNFIGEIS